MITPVQEQYLLYYVIIGISSIFITWLSIPCSIEVSRSKIQHTDITWPGSVTIFTPISLFLWGSSNPMLPVNYQLTASVILLAIGIRDYLTYIRCDIKLFTALIASLILIIPGNIRLYKLQDALGFYELPYFPAVILLVLIIMFLIKAFNLIDGINSLAATTGIMLNSIVSAVLIDLDQYELAAVSLVSVGVVSSFLKFILAQPKYTWVFA